MHSCFHNILNISEPGFILHDCCGMIHNIVFRLGVQTLFFLSKFVWIEEWLNTLTESPPFQENGNVWNHSFNTLKHLHHISPPSVTGVETLFQTRWGRSTSSSYAAFFLFWWPWWQRHLMLMTVVRSGRMAGSDRCLCGLGVPAHTAGVWPRRKEAARGQTLCQLIVQRVGRAWGGWHAWARKARQDPHSFGILARASGKIKWSNLSWFRSAGEYSNIYFCRAFGEAVLAPQISKRTKFSSVSCSAILIACWPPVVENGCEGGSLPSTQSSSSSPLLTSFP